MAAGEKIHRGQVRFVVEVELTSAQLWRDVSSRDRAVEVFSMERVWNTEENIGVLVYVLAGVDAIGALLARHFPSQGTNANELPDRPLML